jgi:hypothetical protein
MQLIPRGSFKKEIKMNNNTLLPNANWQTQQRGSNNQEYQIYLTFADDGKGGDITRNGAPLLTFDQWLQA